MLPLLLLAQAAQAVQAAASTTPSEVLQVATLTVNAFTVLALAVIRRGSNARVLKVEKVVSAAVSKWQATEKMVAEHEELCAEHGARINDLDERISATDPNLRSRDVRLDKIERDITEEKAAREKRRETQATQDLELTRTLTAMGANLAHLKERIDEAHHAAPRRR